MGYSEVNHGQQIEIYVKSSFDEFEEEGQISESNESSLNSFQSNDMMDVERRPSH